MAVTKNAFYSNSFLIFIIRFFPTLANLMVMVYYSKYLPKEQYGIYNNFWTQLNIFYPFICIGLQALVVTYPAALLVQLIRHIKAKQYLVFAAWALSLGIGFAVLEQSQTGIPIPVSLFFILSFAFTFIFESLLMVFKDFRSLIAINVLYSVAYWVAHYLVLKGFFSINNIFLILLIITMVRAAIYYIILIFAIKLNTPTTNENTLPDIPQISNLWLHLGIYDIVQSLSMWIDKFIVSLFLTASVSAVYYNGSMNIPFLPLLITAAGSALLMQLAGGERNDEKVHAIVLLNQTGKALSSIVFPVFFFLLFFSRELFVGFLFGVKYEAALPIFIASLLILPVRAYNFTSVLQRLHLGATINKGAIGEIILAILIAYPMYLWLGLPGLALSFVISTYLQATYYIISTARLLQVTVWQLIPARNWLIKFVFTGIAIFALHKLSAAMFTGHTALYFGGCIMVLMVGITLFLEMKKGTPIPIGN
jgi:O-antigen/teichoic acid export membrane protein